MRRLLKLIVLGGAGYALWRLLTASDPEPAAPADDPAVPVPGALPAGAASSPPSPSEPLDGRVPAPAKAATKAELYARATELGIAGRSKMNKAELERAIREAG